jgi:hypothetical protein
MPRVIVYSFAVAAAVLIASACDGRKNASDDEGGRRDADGGEPSAGKGGTSGGTAGSGAGGSTAGEGATDGDGGANDTGGTGGTGGSGGSGGAGASGGSGGAGASGGSGGTEMTAGAGGSGGVGGSDIAGGGGSGGGGSGGSAGDGGGAGGSSGATGGDGGTGGSAGAGGSGGGPNLIINGDFSNDVANWNTNGASANSSVTDGVWCGQFLTTDARIILGWPQFSSGAIALSGEYTFSFKMSLSGNATILAKVGMAVTPYTTDFQIAVNPGQSLTSFSYTFPVEDSQAGIAFDIIGHSPPTIVCIDDVALTRQ